MALGNTLEKFFEPETVAVVGASSTPGKAGNDILLNILANDYAGSLYLVNPKGGEILGRRVYPSIRNLPDGIDLAVIILPARANPQALRDCAAKGIRAVVLVAGGFAEVDGEGEILQGKMAAVIRETGIRVLGPNTSGLLSIPHNLAASFFPLGRVPRGGISYMAQTGNFATHTMRYIMSAENFGVARVAGLGNKVDVDESEVLEYLGDDPETRAILVYLESFKRPKRFVEIARRVTRHKPVILLKGGSTERGAEAALTHTAALASDDRILTGALAQAGVVRIWKYSHLFLVPKGLASMPLPEGRRVGFLAPSGAMAVCLTDLCAGELDLRVPDLEEFSRKRLQEISPPFIKIRNPVDIWPAATVRGIAFAYREGIETLMSDAHIDAVVAILMLTEETGIPPLDFLVEVSRRHPERPLYVSCSGEKRQMEAAKAFLEPRRVPVFLLPEEAFEVLGVLARCREAMKGEKDHGG
ncbi:MAG: CoA-binding protein [Deltaproteobacteria bacterium]|nr:CoA-binding protein [Deltaproteobacteria bacterium]